MDFNSKTLTRGAIILLVTIAGLWGVWKLTTAPADQAQDTPVSIEVAADENIKGNVEAPVTLIEYADMQCPACRSYAPLIREALNANPETLRVVFRHFPLAQHQNAEVAAYATEAAGNQGKFFEMHDILFDRQDDWADASDPTELFTTYAEELELDIEQFTADLNSPEVKERVESDLTEALSLGVNSTPTFFLNGTMLKNPRSLEELQAAIDEAAASTSEDDAMEDSEGDAQMEDSEDSSTDGDVMEDDSMESESESDSANETEDTEAEE